MIGEQSHDASSPATGAPAEGPEESSGASVGGTRQDGVGNVILRAIAVLLDMLTWWPEALIAGQVCLAALEVRQGTDRK